MRHRIKAGKVGSFTPEKQKVEIEQLENREVADEVEELSDSDTTSTTVQKEENKHKEKLSLPVNSPSSTSHKSSGYDNMRGFDPASEDDMEDNGMSRYMENNDEEGWD